MNIYLSEDEQIQKIKEWLKEYGIAIVVGIAVFFAGSFGWRYWQQYKNRQAVQASSIYEQVVSAHIARNYDDVKLYAQNLRNDYARTPYAGLASLISARDATVKKDLPTAEQNLQWTIDHAKSAGIRQIARIRLARVFLENKQPQKALGILERVDDKTYLAMVHETKGDIYLATDDKNLAMQEYRSATEAAPENSVTKSIIEMKINQLLK